MDNGHPIIIVGDGVFGLSTADHVRKRCPAAPLSIISHPSPQAPSNDDAKIVRIDYPYKERMKEAIESQRLWKTELSFSPYYHSIGRLVAYDKDDSTPSSINETRAQLGMEARQRLEGRILTEKLGSKDVPPSLTIIFNSDDAIVDWKGCMNDVKRRVTEACSQSGGKLLEGKVKILEHDGNRIKAIILADGKRIETETAQVVLAVGPWFAEILTNSGIDLPPSNRLPVATGLFAYNVQLNDKQVEIFRGKPIFSHIGKAEFLPPVLRDGIAKITWINPFTNFRNESSVSYVQDLSGSVLARREMQRMISWANQFLPDLQGARIISGTSYWLVLCHKTKLR